MFKKMHRALFTVIFLVVMFNCSERKRLNPLDPANPETHGRVSGVSVVSYKNKVYLSWYPVFNSSVTEYKIYRSTNSPDRFVNVGTVGTDSCRFTDIDVNFDTLYFYSVTACTETYETPFSDSLSITPGPVCFWIADRYNGLVTRLSYDISHRFFISTYLPGPVDVSADPLNSKCYVIDRSGFLTCFAGDGNILLFESGLSFPEKVSFDYFNNKIWIVENRGTALSCFDTTGAKLYKFDNFRNISSVKWSSDPPGCWVADSSQSMIFFVTQSGIDTFSTQINLSKPVFITKPVKEDYVYVTSGNMLYKFKIDGTLMFNRDLLSTPVFVTCDDTSGACWVALKNGGIKKISSTGEQVLNINGFTQISSVAPDWYTGGAVIADAGRSCLVHVSGSGEIIKESFIVSFPGALCSE